MPSDPQSHTALYAPETVMDSHLQYFVQRAYRSRPPTFVMPGIELSDICKGEMKVNVKMKAYICHS